MATTSTTSRKQSKPSAASKATHTGINVLVPVALHRKLRLKAVTEGLTLSEAIEQAVKAWVR